MAHKEKYIRSSVGHMFMHYDRSKTVPDLANSDCTNLNYNLAQEDQALKQYDFLQQRLSEIRVHNRKDVNVMVDWVVTLPKSLSNLEDEKKFFKEAYNFLNDRYGKENVISSYVHKDEITPHMHYSFVPVIEDKKRDSYKLSAKEVITRNDLRTFHGNLSDHMEKSFGYDIGILNEATKNGNKSIQELKRQSATERLEEINTKASKIVSNANDRVDRANNAVKSIRAEFDAKKAYIRLCDEASEVSTSIPDYAVVKEKGIFKKKEYITVPLEKWKAKHVSANEKDYLERATKVLEHEISGFQSSTSGKYLQNLEYENRELREKNQTLYDDNVLSIHYLQLEKEKSEKLKQDMTELVEKIERTLDKIPENSAELFKTEWNFELEQERSRGFER